MIPFFQKAFSIKLSHFLVFGNDLANKLENMIIYPFVSHDVR